MHLRLVSLTALLTVECAAFCVAAKVPSKRDQVPLLAAQSKPTKRVAIVGGGTGGVTALKTLLGDLPSETTRDWEIVLFEQHRDVGGVWSALQDSTPSFLTQGCFVGFPTWSHPTTQNSLEHRYTLGSRPIHHILLVSHHCWIQPTAFSLNINFHHYSDDTQLSI